jgi:hypothetical protein
MRRLIVAMIGAALLALALGIGLAVAGGPIDPDDGDDFVGKAGGLRYSQDSALADSGSANLAGCGPAKYHLIGAGEIVAGAADASYLRGGRGWDYTDPDSDFDDGFFAIGTGSPGAPLSVTAICRRSVMRYRFKELPSKDQQVATLGCGGSAWHVTTGSPFLSQSTNFVNSSYPVDGGDRDHVPDDAWRVRVLSQTGGPSLHVVCARNVDLTYRKSKPVTLGSSQVKTRTVGCGRKHVVGGGARLSGLINRGRLMATVPIDKADPGAVPDDAWRAKAFNIGGTPTKLTGFAICLG